MRETAFLQKSVKCPFAYSPPATSAQCVGLAVCTPVLAATMHLCVRLDVCTPVFACSMPPCVRLDVCTPVLVGTVHPCVRLDRCEGGGVVPVAYPRPLEKPGQMHSNKFEVHLPEINNCS